MLCKDALCSQTQIASIGQDKSSLSGRRAASEILLLCTTSNISPERKERISQFLAGNVDWRYLYDLAEFQGVAPLIAHNLATNGLTSQVPQPYLERLSQTYNNTLYRNVVFSAELENVLSVFCQHEIATITLKGTILAEQLYGNPGLRTVVDMDILVQPEKIPLASSLLLEMGYQQFAPQRPWNHPFHEVPFCKQAQFPLFIELHWNLDDPRLVAVPKQRIWHRAQPLQTQGGTTSVLSPEDTLLFLSVHLSKQFNQLLRSLGDIAELLKKYHSVLDWDYIVESAHSWEIGTFVYYYLKRSKELLGAPVPASAIRALKPKAWRRWLLDFLLSQEFFISASKLSQLREETCAISRSLMMRHANQTALVLIRHRGSWKRAIWPRTAIRTMLVFSAALGHAMVRIGSGLRWRAP